MTNSYVLSNDTMFAMYHDADSRIHTLFLRDGDHTNRHLDLDVSIKSGEYFLTLATILDSLSDHPELQQIIRDLLYIQKNYKIVKR